MVYDCDQLLERDRADFETYLGMIDQDQIKYHKGIADWAPLDNELVIIDEADSIMYSEPEMFRDFISKCACICFTATPDDNQSAGIDSKVLAAM
jgi:hypothetical protein